MKPPSPSTISCVLSVCAATVRNVPAGTGLLKETLLKFWEEQMLYRLTGCLVNILFAHVKERLYSLQRFTLQKHPTLPITVSHTH